VGGCGRIVGVGAVAARREDARASAEGVQVVTLCGALWLLARPASRRRRSPARRRRSLAGPTWGLNEILLERELSCVWVEQHRGAWSRLGGHHRETSRASNNARRRRSL